MIHIAYIIAIDNPVTREVRALAAMVLTYSPVIFLLQYQMGQYGDCVAAEKFSYSCFSDDRV